MEPKSEDTLIGAFRRYGQHITRIRTDWNTNSQQWIETIQRELESGTGKNFEVVVPMGRLHLVGPIIVAAGNISEVNVTAHAFTEEQFGLLCEAIKRSKSVQLVDFITGTGLLFNMTTERAHLLGDMLAVNSSLQSLAVSGGLISFNHILRGLKTNHSVTHLTAHIHIGLVDDYRVVAELCSLPSLRSLELIFIDEDKEYTNGFYYIGRAIATNQTLDKLHIGLHDHFSGPMMEQLTNGLKMNHSIQELRIFAAKMEVECMMSLMGLFEVNKTITSLALKHSVNNVNCCELLGDLLANNGTLLELDLSQNNFQNGILTIVDGLIDNEVLTKLDISHNASEQYINEVLDALEQNYSLTEFDCDYPKPPKENTFPAGIPPNDWGMIVGEMEYYNKKKKDKENKKLKETAGHADEFIPAQDQNARELIDQLLAENVKSQRESILGTLVLMHSLARHDEILLPKHWIDIFSNVRFPGVRVDFGEMARVVFKNNHKV